MCYPPQDAPPQTPYELDPPPSPNWKPPQASYLWSLPPPPSRQVLTLSLPSEFLGLPPPPHSTSFLPPLTTLSGAWPSSLRDPQICDFVVVSPPTWSIPSWVTNHSSGRAQRRRGNPPPGVICSCRSPPAPPWSAQGWPEWTAEHGQTQPNTPHSTGKLGTG